MAQGTLRGALQNLQHAGELQQLPHHNPAANQGNAGPAIAAISKTQRYQAGKGK
jgi:hypothetical protein